ncbi:hypothetical protein [Micromonospora sp. NPDC049301]|uniref:hypothetical protein n=1 Tax=Micromonospora sp. NPDC049301 TaxID=3155723 RepID=UPI00343D4FBF
MNVELVQRTGELERFDLSQSAMTILTGPRNSSKTTTLKVIDYCLGGRGSVAEDLGAPIDEKYAALSIQIAINGQPHWLTREFGFGQRGVVQIDDDTAVPVVQMSDWLLGKLGWPRLTIPLGRNAGTATQQTPLSFRSALRHIYRREDSWTEFASKEQEYLRRAVVSLFLGFAPQRYETTEYELGRAQRQLAAAEAVLRDVLASTDEATRAVVHQLGLPPVVNADSLQGVRDEIDRRLTAAQSERDALAGAAARARQADETAPGLDPGLPAQLQEASAQAADAAGRVASLLQVIDEHQRSMRLVAADLERFNRLTDAVDAFDAVPVRICPACEQDVDPRRVHDEASCYLCSQSVVGDARRRRAEREQQALAAEQSDLADALARAASDLRQARQNEAEASERRVRLAGRLHDERVTQLAPFVAALEDAAREIGLIEQQRNALPALEIILARRQQAEHAVETARQEVARLTRLAALDADASADIPDRCGVLADHMNSFLRHFRDRGWVAGQVTISGDELAFYVGTRPWDHSLGAEARVLFFLAYSYAILRLTDAEDRRTCPPGILLLDNPYQQGLPADVVVHAIGRIGTAADQVGGQVILTQARPVSGITAPHASIQMPQEYAT